MIETWWIAIESYNIKNCIDWIENSKLTYSRELKIDNSIDDSKDFYIPLLKNYKIVFGRALSYNAIILTKLTFDKRSFFYKTGKNYHIYNFSS